MNNELPYQTFERVTGKKWTGGNSADVQNAYKQYGITAPAGSSEGNLALQKALQNLNPQAPQNTANQPVNQVVSNQEWITETRMDGDGNPYQVRIKNPSFQTNQPTTRNVDIPTNPFMSNEELDFEAQKENYLKGLTAPIDENAIREEAIKRMQAQIDATNRMYADELARAKVQGTGRLGTTTAIQGKRGLIGSDFGEAQIQGTENLNEQVYQSIEQERLAKISALMNDARSYADQEIRNRREQMLAGFDARTQLYATKEERKNKATLSAVQALIDKGVAPDEIGNLGDFARYYGITENELKSKYQTAKKQIEAEQAKQDLELRKQEADIKKIEADIAKGKLIELSEGGMIYNTETGEVFKNPKTSTASRTTSGGGAGSSTAQYTSDLDAIIGNTLATIGSQFGQEQFQIQLSKTRNDADKINLIGAVVLKNAPSTVKQDFANQSIGISNIDKAITEIDKGAKSGFINSKLQKGFNLVGRDYDPSLATISSYITAAIQPYRSSVTGAAWGSQEENEYQQLFGSTLYSPTELKQRLTRLKEIMKDKSAQGLNVYVNPMGTYENPFASNTNQPITPSNTVTVYSVKTGKPAQIPADKLQQALSSGLFKQ